MILLFFKIGVTSGIVSALILGFCRIIGGIGWGLSTTILAIITFLGVSVCFVSIITYFLSCVWSM